MTPTNQVESVECFACSTVTPLEDTQERSGHQYCDDCYAEEFDRSCCDCGDTIDVDDTYQDGGDDLCCSCNDSRNEDNEESEEYESTGSVEREYSSKDLPEFQSTEVGKYITSPRVFSAEIECYYPDFDALRKVATALPRGIGVSGDGSLGNNGIEFQTPKLKGKAGEDTVLSMLKTLNDNDFTVNRSAGLHIHLDGETMLPQTRTKDNPYKIKALWSFYLVFEDVFLSFLPQSRRRNQYCGLVKNEFHVKEISNCNTLEALEKLWYRTNIRTQIAQRKGNKYDNSRYLGVNLHSLFSNKHLEIRYHSGTLNHVKVLEWANLHQTIMDLSEARGLDLSIGAQNLPALEDKTELFFQILRLPARSEQYFKSRQEQFKDISKRDNEEDNLIASDIVPQFEALSI